MSNATAPATVETQAEFFALQAQQFIEPGMQLNDFSRLSPGAAFIKLMWGANHSSGRHNVDNRDNGFPEFIHRLGLDHRQKDYVWMDTINPFRPHFKMMLCATADLHQVRFYTADLMEEKADLIFLIESPGEFNLPEFLLMYYNKMMELTESLIDKAQSCGDDYRTVYKTET